MTDPMTVKLNWREREALSWLLKAERFDRKLGYAPTPRYPYSFPSGVGAGTLDGLAEKGLLVCVRRDVSGCGCYSLGHTGTARAEAEEAHGT